METVTTVITQTECDEFDSDESDDILDDGNIFEQLDIF